MRVWNNEGRYAQDIIGKECGSTIRTYDERQHSEYGVKMRHFWIAQLFYHQYMPVIHEHKTCYKSRIQACCVFLLNFFYVLSCMECVCVCVCVWCLCVKTYYERPEIVYTLA